LKGRRGFVQSPNYPNGYPKNVNCEWVVQVQPHYSVQITKATIDLPPRSNIGLCDKDVITFREGNSSAGDILGRFCGKQDVGKYKTEFNTIFMSFQTDGVVDGAYRGAYAQYDTGKCCLAPNLN